MRAALPAVLALLASLSFSADFTFCVEDQDNPPYQTGPEKWKSSDQGLVVDLVNLAADYSDNNISYIHRPWKRCQQELKNGAIDGVIAFIFTEERDQWVVFPKTEGVPDDRYSFLGEYRVFVHKDNELDWNGESFSDPFASVQSIPGYVADQKLRTMRILPKVELQPAKGLEMVSRGRIDGYVIDRLIGWEIAKKQGIKDELRAIETPFMSQAWYVAFSRKAFSQSEEDIERFWTILATVRDQYGPLLEQKYLSLR